MHRKKRLEIIQPPLHRIRTIVGIVVCGVVVEGAALIVNALV